MAGSGERGSRGFESWGKRLEVVRVEVGGSEG